MELSSCVFCSFCEIWRFGGVFVDCVTSVKFRNCRIDYEFCGVIVLDSWCVSIEEFLFWEFCFESVSVIVEFQRSFFLNW